MLMKELLTDIAVTGVRLKRIADVYCLRIGRKNVLNEM